jgi:hypothetical protein
MKAAKASSAGAGGPVEQWDAALRPLVKKSPDLRPQSSLPVPAAVFSHF